ncbi:MFS general substrate transporter [Delitschia confertaspora ATCC 74209]|uniref:MFS general substrate transporter n=1 Tax=Delitschia confertaspora ATCC 74209 TaxID=1513339 RepID=A0A9P4JKX7_9PLEO|nr:MFS general substrate transporter [Delitschia confertaspora ATCC 74209]
MGFLGILEYDKLDHVPATVLLTDRPRIGEITSSNAPLKHGTGKNADIVLVPQPSDDPNDPLNWTTMKKLTTILIVIFGCTLYGAVIAPLLLSAVGVIARDFGKFIGTINNLSGYMLLVTSCMGPFVCAISRKYGKRPVLLVSSLFAMIGTIVGSATSSYKGFLACRIIQGAAISAFESLGVAIIGDLIFLHHRGYFMTIFQFTLGVITNLTSIVTGPIATNLGWKYLFHIMIAFSAFETIILFLFVPETSYNRDPLYDIDEAVAAHSLSMGNSSGKAQKVETEICPESMSTSSPTPRSYPPKKTFTQELSLWSGQIYSHEPFYKLVLAPFLILTNLTVLWFVLITGGLAVLLVSTSMVTPQIFMAPPYSLNPAGIGYLSTGPVVGGIVASLLVGSTGDPLVKWCAGRNEGVYEPEYRLLGMLPSVVAGAGLVGFGYATQNGESVYVTATMLGITIFGIVAASIAASAYILDAFRSMSSELFIMNMVSKNLVMYGFSTFVNEWMREEGPVRVFSIFGGVAWALVVTTPVVFFWGKRYRGFWHGHNVLERLKIGTHAEF